MKKVLCQSITEGVTKAFGRKLASHLNKGGTVFLIGDLGTGKTTFVQGVGEGLGITQTLTSPTFTLMNVYQTHHVTMQKLVHVDLYRLTAADRIAELDLETWQTDPHALMLIEWPERLATNSWHNILGTISFAQGETLNQRLIEISGVIATIFR